jgi:hypothetical protein
MIRLYRITYPVSSVNTSSGKLTHEGQPFEDRNLSSTRDLCLNAFLPQYISEPLSTTKTVNAVREIIVVNCWNRTNLKALCGQNT